MESKLPMPSPSPEAGGYPRREMPSITPERSSQPRVEVQPKSSERLEVQQPAPAADPVVVPAAPPPQPLLPTPAPTAPSIVQTAAASSNPTVANDKGLIEKEWVDKAKKIVQQTRSDPYEQEKEVTKLQADYMKKRYGKDIKLST